MVRGKRWQAAAVIFLAAGLVLAIGLGGRSGDTVLEFGMFAGSNWGVANADSCVIIDKAIEKYERAHPGVRIHYYSGIPKDDYPEWLARKILGGETPDVFMVLSNDLDKMVSLGVLADLGPWMEKDQDFSKSAFFQTALAAGVRDHQQYALPYETVPTLMFVNKTLLNQAGFGVPDNDWDWDRLLDICKKITKDTDGDGRVDRFGTYNYGWMEAAYSNGGKLFDEDGTKCYIHSEQVAQAVRYVNGLSDLNQGQKVTQEDFDGGHVAFMPLSFAEYRTYKSYPYKIKKYSTFQWDCITLPAGPQGDNISEVDSLLIGISSHSRKKQLAWEFLKMLTYDEEIQMEIFRYSQGASVLRSVTGSEQMEEIVRRDMEASDRVIDHKLLSTVIEKGRAVPRFSRYGEALALAESEVLKIYEGEKNVDSSLKIARRTIDHFLAR